MSATDRPSSLLDKPDLMEAWINEAHAQRDSIVAEIFPTVPEYVRCITSSEVMYTFRPNALPYRNISFVELREALARHYDLQPNIGEIMEGLPDGRAGAVTPDEIATMILRSSNTRLSFQDGLLRMPHGRAIVIEEVLFARESLFCKVIGPSRAGDQIIYELLPMLWALAGVKRSWSEIEVYNQRVKYGTGTQVFLSDSGRGLLSAAFLKLLDDWCSQDGLASQMGARDVLADGKPPQGATVRFSLDELHLIFNRTAAVGISEETKLRIGVDARNERGTGIFTVGSELPFTEHLELVKTLLEPGLTPQKT